MEHLHPGHGLAFCARCRVLIDLETDPRSGTPAHAIVPASLDFQVRDYGLRLTWKPRSRLHPLLGALIVWTLGWVALALTTDSASALDDIATWGPFAVIAVSLCGIYAVLARIVNRATLRVERGRLLIEYGPLPFLGNRDWRAPNVLELACETRTQRGGRSSGGRQATRLFVVARKSDGREEHTDLVDNIPDEEFGVFLMRTIERVIDIPRPPPRPGQPTGQWHDAPVQETAADPGDGPPALPR